MSAARSWTRRLVWLAWAGPTAIAVCYFALWACAPMFSQPAPTPIAGGNDDQIGLSGGTALEVFEGGSCADYLLPTSCPGPELALWYRHRYDKLELGVTAHGGVLSVVGAGVSLRGYFIETDAARLGLSGGVGWLNVRGGVPAAVRVAPAVWLYTEPTLATATLGLGRLPLGVSGAIGRTNVDFEVGLATGVDLTPVGYGGLGVGFSF